MTAAEILAGCGDLVPVEKVLQLDTRWGNAQSLARATREGRGPAGRVLLSPTRAAYQRSAIESFLAERDARAAQLLAERQERAERARRALAALPPEERRARVARGRAARAERRATYLPAAPALPPGGAP